MKDIVLHILDKYLEVFPEEKERQAVFMQYLQNHKDCEINDWNNYDGHIVADGFVYAVQEKKILVVYHKDLKMYLCPGGHVDKNDATPLDAARREVKEETGLEVRNPVSIVDNQLIPIDIDTHMIGYNERRNIPAHYHFDLRYLFIIDKVVNIEIDIEESEDYRWIDLDELCKSSNYNEAVLKIKKLLRKRVNEVI